MITLAAGCVAILFSAGVYLILSRNLQRLILGFLLISNGVNLMVLSSGPFRVGSSPPIVGAGEGPPADPLPQAFLLTAIVIGLGAAVYLLATAVAAFGATGSDDLGDD